MSPITILLAVILVAYLIYRYLYQRHFNFPPGPRGYPVLGYGIQLFKSHKFFHVAIDMVTRKYGPVVGIYFGPKPLILVNGFKAVKEALSNEDIDGRPLELPAVFPPSYARKGIVASDGDLWKQQQRFTIRHLRDFGFGRNSMEGIIHEEIKDLLSDIQNIITKSSDNSVQMERLFIASILNLLWHVVGGIRFNHDDERLLKLLHVMEEIVKSGNTGNFSDVLPFLRKVFPKWTGYEEKQQRFEILDKFLQDAVTEHQTTFDPNHIRDFIDIYLQEMSEGKDDKFNRDQLVVICFDMLGAGSETSSTFLSFAFLYMILHPDVQKKVQKELDEVVGRDRLPSFQDKADLPYAEATWMEALRISCIAATTIPHRVMRDTKLMGYNIPKNAMCFASLWSVNMDKEYWGDPQVFRPERFFDGNGKLKKADDHLFTFGYGKRACLGESLARRSTFIFFTALLQAFNFSALPGEPIPDPSDPVPGFALSLPPFKFRVTSRV